MGWLCQRGVGMERGFGNRQAGQGASLSQNPRPGVRVLSRALRSARQLSAARDQICHGPSLAVLGRDGVVARPGGVDGGDSSEGEGWSGSEGSEDDDERGREEEMGLEERAMRWVLACM